MTAAFALALMSATMAVPACAHASPASFVNCMSDSGKGGALINAVSSILDGDNRVQVLEQLAVTVGPDVLKCALEQIASAKSVGPAGGARSTRAREYLDSHGGAGASMATPEHHAGVFVGDGDRLSEITFRDGPLFDSPPLLRVTFFADKPMPCEPGTHDLILPPMALGTACAIDDYTFDAWSWRAPAPAPWVDRSTLLEI